MKAVPGMRLHLFRMSMIRGSTMMAWWLTSSWSIPVNSLPANESPPTDDKAYSTRFSSSSRVAGSQPLACSTVYFSPPLPPPHVEDPLNTLFTPYHTQKLLISVDNYLKTYWFSQRMSVECKINESICCSILTWGRTVDSDLTVLTIHFLFTSCLCYCSLVVDAARVFWAILSTPSFVRLPPMNPLACTNTQPSTPDTPLSSSPLNPLHDSRRESLRNAATMTTPWWYRESGNNTHSQNPPWS